MLFFDTSVVLFSRDGLQVQWRWDPQGTDPTTVELEVQRSGSPVGPWSQLSVVDPRTTFSFFDKTTPTRPQNEDLYWRLRAVLRTDGSEVAVSNPFGLNGPLSQDALWIIEQQRILLDGVNGHRAIKGIPVTIYRKRNFGVPCPECRDAVTGRVSISNCRMCHGSGKLDGYFDSVDVGANISQYTTNVQLGNLQKVENSDTSCFINNFPAVYPGDIVVEPSERHWRVTRVEPRERYRTIVRQALSMTQIKPDDIVNQTLRHSSHGGKAR